MRMTRQIVIQLLIFSVLATTALAVMVFGYMRLPAMVGIGQYRITVELPETGGLYPRGNVTYRGTQVGTVKSVNLIDSGVAAELSLDSGIKIPADVEAEVHSQSAVGELYVTLLPRSGEGPVLKDGDVIPQDRTRVPTNVNAVLGATNRGLAAIPRDNLKTAVDEAYVAVGGLGPELSRLVQGGTALAIDARKNLDPLTTLIDQSKPILDTQTDTSDSIQAWASHLATVTQGLQSQDSAVAGILEKGPGAADEVRALFDRLQPTLPIVLANLVSIGEVAVTYQPSLEQLIVLLPQGTATTAAIGVAQAQHQTGLHGRLSDAQSEPQPAAAVQHRLPADPAAAGNEPRGLSRPPGGRRLLPGAAGWAVQRSRRPQPALHHRSRQTRADGEDVREQRELRPPQRRLQLEG